MDVDQTEVDKHKLLTVCEEASNRRVPYCVWDLKRDPYFENYPLGKGFTSLGLALRDAWTTAKDVAEKTRHAVLAEEIDGRLVSEWLEGGQGTPRLARSLLQLRTCGSDAMHCYFGNGQATDLADYEAFFRATEASSKFSQRESARESWLRPLWERPPDGRKEALRAQAAEEGVRIFDLKQGDRPSEAASWLERITLKFYPLFYHREYGLSDVEICWIMAGPKYFNMFSPKAELLRRAADAEPGGNRGERRYSLGRTTTVAGTLELSESPEVCSVLEAFWGSPSFFVQCTGGDASFPGAKQQDLHADVPVKEVADQLYSYHDPENPVGPPRFAKGTHMLTPLMDAPPPSQEPPTVRAFCPAGSAIIMDMRVWHGGTANLSAMARPMLSVHYAGPDYSEDVLKDGGSIPSFGTCYWCYHRGAVSAADIEQLSPRGRLLCQHLVVPETQVYCAMKEISGRLGESLVAASCITTVAEQKKILQALLCPSTSGSFCPAQHRGRCRWALALPTLLGGSKAQPLPSLGHPLKITVHMDEKQPRTPWKSPTRSFLPRCALPPSLRFKTCRSVPRSLTDLSKGQDCLGRLLRQWR
ncbi:hypothetical protein AK812_SmicGene16473 [Symbiodinium microadriaticum]|uniref:Kanamycin B dioxygenase n=1 Tax=Symbiodinium microadriaticum TaxID=2951 RepID=A0A1Q9E075_SYMMI|nr:hypothetical protein AK812_SmicGene16473 [Symbiodinium microadriaticum]